ncbi:MULTISPECIES: hypothetical protein [Kitasatospora]|uniref:Uncharacterized protein n=1 Tax=Kitasatospora setae (strain ATCC 33774 / DSM 43861 / JCM 3304 / KCC A-0304 / NBRC 14216 / KM-6054) TaxID=452652 RepID=E4N5Z9_KITSK|nr:MULTISPECIES: hypothetical protein [Kitasatospora]BAJ26630.1 hypothetical protein KSE_07910 [Kitasatospora setae KM-6054]
MTEQLCPLPPGSTPRRRLCMTVDVARYSRLDTLTQLAVQTDLVRLLDEAARRSGLDRTAWERQPQGDAEFDVLPEGVPETVVLGPFVHHLSTCLHLLNARTDGPRLRMRLAIDSGVATTAALGHAGPGPVAVARYVNAHQLKAALAGLPSADLAVIISDRLYQDVVRSGHPGLDPAQYLRVHVRIKEFLSYGWIRVPGHGPDDLRAFADGPLNPPPPPAPADGFPFKLAQHVRHGAAVGRDVHGAITIGPAPSPSDSAALHLG